MIPTNPTTLVVLTETTQHGRDLCWDVCSIDYYGVARVETPIMVGL